MSFVGKQYGQLCSFAVVTHGTYKFLILGQFFEVDLRIVVRKTLLNFTAEKLFETELVAL